MKDLLLRHKLFFGTIIFLILLIIPLTVLQVQQQQELRQRASGGPPVGIRLCFTSSTSIVNCSSTSGNDNVSSSSPPPSYTIAIAAVNTSDQNVDISAFDVELNYDIGSIKTISYQKRNNSPSYPYTVILPDKDTTYVKSEFKSPNDQETTGKLRIVGTKVPKDTDDKDNIPTPPNGIVVLAFINVESVNPQSVRSFAALDITADTKIAASKSTSNIYNAIPLEPGTHAFTMNFTKTDVPATPTVAPTNTPTPIPGAPTATPVPTSTPTPIPTNSNLTTLSFSISLPELTAPNSGPKNLKVAILNPITNNIVKESAVGLTYNSVSDKFEGGNTIDWIPASGTYNVKVKVGRYLRKLVSAVQITKNQQNNISITSSLAIGDVDDNNIINIADYGIIRDCFDSNKPISDSSSKFSSPQCTPHAHKTDADLNEDGFINQVDYNLFLKSLSFTTREGD